MPESQRKLLTELSVAFMKFLYVWYGPRISSAGLVQVAGGDGQVCGTCSQGAEQVAGADVLVMLLPRAPRSAGTPKCPSAPVRPWIGPSVFRDVDRRAQPAVRQWLVVESWNDVHMGMQDTALVPAQQIAVWG